MACTSDMKTRRDARRCLLSLLVMPEYFAVLIALMRQPTAVASPITLAPEDCAWRRKDDMSEALSGWRTAPITFPPAAFTTSEVDFSSPWPKAKSTVTKYHVSPPSLRIDFATTLESELAS